MPTKQPRHDPRPGRDERNCPVNRRHLYRGLFTAFFRIGLFTFGGGYAMIPLMEQEVVVHKKWLSAEEVMDIMAIAQSLPGPIAVNTATFIGRRLAGWRGALISLLGCVLPSVLVILIVAACLANIQDNPLLQNIFRGIRAAVTALILAAAIRLAKKSVRGAFTLFLAAATIIAVSFLKLPALAVIIAGAAAGLLYSFLRKNAKNGDQASPQEKEAEIEDDANTR